MSYDTGMSRRFGSSPTPARKAGNSSSQVTEVADELAVRSYLRALVGAPVRSADRVETTEVAFVDAVGRWSDRAGVDRRTLSRIGVERAILDASGLKQTPVGDVVRRHYQTEPASIADLARRSGVSPASVRQTVYDDESEGLIQAVHTKGKTVLYGLVR